MEQRIQLNVLWVCKVLKGNIGPCVRPQTAPSSVYPRFTPTMTFLIIEILTEQVWKRWQLPREVLAIVWKAIMTFPSGTSVQPKLCFCFCTVDATLCFFWILKEKYNLDLEKNVRLIVWYASKWKTEKLVVDFNRCQTKIPFNKFLSTNEMGSNTERYECLCQNTF